MAKTDIAVDELLRMTGHDQLSLPELQRRYIWPATRVRDLLDSLYRNYPSGSILPWRTDHGGAGAGDAGGQARSPFGWTCCSWTGSDASPPSLPSFGTRRYTKDGSGQQTFHVRNGNRTDPLSIEDAHRYIDQHFR